MRQVPAPLDITDLLTIGSCFVLVTAVVLAVAVLLHARHAQRRQDLDKRLGMEGSDDRRARQLHLWQDGKHATTNVPAVPRRPSLRQRAAAFRQQANLRIPLSLLAIQLAAMAAGAMAAVWVVSGNLLLAMVAALAVLWLAWTYFRWRVEQRWALFERQIVDAMQLAARSLRAGHPLLGAFQLIAEDVEDPVKGIFATICQQQEMGVSLERTLEQVSGASGSMDLKLFATSVAIQIKCGGNLADMMDRVSEVIRERIRLSRRVRVLTAMTQFSKRILLALPVILFGALYLIRPDYMQTFRDTSEGQWMLVSAAAGLLLGAYMMNRMARVKW